MRVESGTQSFRFKTKLVKKPVENSYYYPKKPKPKTFVPYSMRKHGRPSANYQTLQASPNETTLHYSPSSANIYGSRKDSKPNAFSSRHLSLTDRVLPPEPNCIILSSNAIFSAGRDSSSPTKTVSENYLNFIAQPTDELKQYSVHSSQTVNIEKDDAYVDSATKRLLKPPVPKQISVSKRTSSFDVQPSVSKSRAGSSRGSISRTELSTLVVKMPPVLPEYAGRPLDHQKYHQASTIAINYPDEVPKGVKLVGSLKSSSILARPSLQPQTKKPSHSRN